MVSLQVAVPMLRDREEVIHSVTTQTSLYFMDVPQTTVQEVFVPDRIIRTNSHYSIKSVIS